MGAAEIIALVALFIGFNEARKPSVPDETAELIRQRVLDCIAIYKQNTGRQMDMPRLVFDNLRAGRYAAASDRYYRIRFDIRRTLNELNHILWISVPHELAHLVNAGKDYHGPEWQQAYLDFGGQPSHLDGKYRDVRE